MFLSFHMVLSFDNAPSVWAILDRVSCFDPSSIITVGEWFRTTAGFIQGCLLSPTLFNIFLERIMTNALEDLEGSVSIGGRTITNLRFADGIDALSRKEEELFKLVNQLEKSSTTYAMEISAKKTKLMPKNTRGTSSDIRIGGQNLETIQSFKYLGQMLPNVLYYFGKGHPHTFSSMDSRTSTTKSLKDKTSIWSEPIADKKGRTHGIYFSNLKKKPHSKMYLFIIWLDNCSIP